MAVTLDPVLKFKLPDGDQVKTVAPPLAETVRVFELPAHIVALEVERVGKGITVTLTLAEPLQAAVVPMMV